MPKPIKQTAPPTTRPPLSRGGRLRAAREAAGLTCAEAGARVEPPIGAQSWLDAERGAHRTLDWWHSAAVAIGADPHAIDPRLASTRPGAKGGPCV